MILRALIAGIFLIAGLTKLDDPQAFADGIASFHFFPDGMINPLAICVPYFEIFTGLGLLSTRWRGAGALAACCLSFCFVLLYASAVSRGLEVSCSCFGKSQILQASTRAGFLRAAVLLLGSAWIYKASRQAGATKPAV